jgi:hypothetical protein
VTFQSLGVKDFQQTVISFQRSGNEKTRRKA